MWESRDAGRTARRVRRTLSSALSLALFVALGCGGGSDTARSNGSPEHGGVAEGHAKVPRGAGVVEATGDPTHGWYRCADQSTRVRGFGKLRAVDLAELSGMTPWRLGSASGLLLVSDADDGSLFFLDTATERLTPIPVSSPGIGGEPEGVAVAGDGRLLVATEPHCSDTCEEPGRLQTLVRSEGRFVPQVAATPLETAPGICADGNCWYEAVAAFRDGSVVLGKERDPPMLLLLDDGLRLTETLDATALVQTLGLGADTGAAGPVARLIELATRIQVQIAGLAAWHEGDLEYLAVVNRLQRRLHVLRHDRTTVPARLIHQNTCCYRLPERSWFGEVEAVAAERSPTGELTLHLGLDTGLAPSPIYSTTLRSVTQLCE